MIPEPNPCSVCSIDMNQATNYVCNNRDCPFNTVVYSKTK